MTDTEATAFCTAPGQNFDHLTKELRLDRYPEHIVEQGDGIDNIFSYDIGTRWFFIDFNIKTGKINRVFFVKN